VRGEMNSSGEGIWGGGVEFGSDVVTRNGKE
jgi:hypothetical protein